MSLTSYRAAPPRGMGVVWCRREPLCASLSGARRRRRGTGSCDGADRGARRCGSGGVVVVKRAVLGRSGNDRLSRVLRHSTIGAEEFNGRVRDGIGFGLLAQITGPAKNKILVGKQWVKEERDREKKE